MSWSSPCLLRTERGFFVGTIKSCASAFQSSRSFIDRGKSNPRGRRLRTISVDALGEPLRRDKYLKRLAEARSGRQNWRNGLKRLRGSLSRNRGLHALRGYINRGGSVAHVPCGPRVARENNKTRRGRLASGYVERRQRYLNVGKAISSRRKLLWGGCVVPRVAEIGALEFSRS